MILWIDSALNEWASWAINQARREVGYPSVSPMFRDTPSSKLYQSHEPGITRANIAAIDGAVMALPGVLKVVIVEYYQRRQSADKAAQKLGLRKSQMYRYIDQAHTHISNHLSSVG